MTEQDIVLALVASPDFARDGLCFAARQSGLYVSGDSGATWRPAFASLGLDTPVAATAIALSPAFPVDRTVFAGIPGAVLRSHDASLHWFGAPLPTPPPVVSTLAPSPDYARDGMVLAGTVEDGVFHSGDRGSSWSAWNFGLLDLGVLTMALSPDFARDETALVGTGSGIFRSTNGGRAWREMEETSEFGAVLSLALSPAYADDGVTFAGTESTGLWRCGNRHGDWTRIDGGAITSAVTAILLAPDYPAAPDILVALDTGLLMSRDDGRTWMTWHTSDRATGAVTAITAPAGVRPAGPLLAGLADGSVQLLTLPR